MTSVASLSGCGADRTRSRAQQDLFDGVLLVIELVDLAGDDAPGLESSERCAAGAAAAAGLMLPLAQHRAQRAVLAHTNVRRVIHQHRAFVWHMRRKCTHARETAKGKLFSPPILNGPSISNARGGYSMLFTSSQQMLSAAMMRDGARP
jgi:hypothetical protein